MDKIKLDDSVIAHIVRLVQLGFLQGLDVVDYFRQIELTLEDSETNSNILYLNKDYLEKHEQEIQNLLNTLKVDESEVSNNTSN
jgi:hypothetical protein